MQCGDRVKKKAKGFEKYPLWMVFVYNIAMLLAYLAGAYILFRLSWIIGYLFIVYLCILELQLYSEGCRYCFYYGKRCVAGKGLIAAVLVKKGAPEKFCQRKLGFKHFIPQILITLIPTIAGIFLLVTRGFHLLTLITLIYPVFSWFAVNPIIYGKIACPNCKQGAICCPALEFFMKKKK